MHSTRKVTLLLVLAFFVGAILSGAYGSYRAKRLVDSTAMQHMWIDMIQGVALVKAMEAKKYDAVHESLEQMLEGNCESILHEDNGDIYKELVGFVSEAKQLGLCL